MIFYWQKIVVEGGEVWHVVFPTRQSVVCVVCSVSCVCVCIREGRGGGVGRREDDIFLYFFKSWRTQSVKDYRWFFVVVFLLFFEGHFVWFVLLYIV